MIEKASSELLCLRKYLMMISSCQTMIYKDWLRCCNHWVQAFSAIHFLVFIKWAATSIGYVFGMTLSLRYRTLLLTLFVVRVFILRRLINEGPDRQPNKSLIQARSLRCPFKVKNFSMFFTDIALCLLQSII